MRVVAIHHNLVGQRLAMPVHGDGGRLMLAKGVRLNASLIAALKRHGFTRVAVDDPLLDDVEPDFAIQEETRQHAVRVLENATGRILSGAQTDLRAVKQAVDLIIADLRANSRASIGLYSLSSFDQETYHHSLNVCILSISIGQELGWSLSDLRLLGTGALLHDIGKLLIPKQIINKPGKLTPEEYGLIKTHTTKGWDLLSKCYDIGAVAAHAALDHHERLDGSGYPRQVMGNQISDIGRITAVTDVYEAMTSDRPQRKAILPDIVQSYLRQESSVTFDAQAVDALFKKVALYPAGTIVSLWGGFIAVVTKQDPRSNARPYVRIVSGPGIRRATDIALYEKPELTINAILDDYPTGAGRLYVETPEQTAARGFQDL